jgi:16S rRNA (cytidine1402-2'-O)-methyltransferase
MTNSSGILYLVATPIGNLEDITYRAVRTLKEADMVFCEDTRRTSILLKHYGIQRSLESFHDHSSRGVLSKIKDMLMEGQTIAYATDGGMPVVSDPGFVLVRLAVSCGVSVSVIPGPSAAVSLFAASSLPTPKYLFHGFFPRTHGEVERVLEQVKTLPVAHLFYEAPGRILSTIEIISRNMPETSIVLGRELTKIHEEILRDKAGKLFETLSTRLGEEGKLRGECVFALYFDAEEARKKAQRQNPDDQVVSPETLEPNAETVVLTAEQQSEIATMVKSGVSSKDAARELSKRFKVSRRVIYEYIVKHLT